MTGQQPVEQVPSGTHLMAAGPHHLGQAQVDDVPTDYDDPGIWDSHLAALGQRLAATDALLVGSWGFTVPLEYAAAPPVGGARLAGLPVPSARVDALVEVVEALGRVWPAEVAASCFGGPNPHLGARPLDAASAGRWQDLLDAVAAEEGGAYA